VIQRGLKMLWGNAAGGLSFPGYSLIPSATGFLRAVRNSVEYLIEERDRVFVLYPITSSGGHSIQLGPPGPLFPRSTVA
jgi:hypothetical protein